MKKQTPVKRITIIDLQVRLARLQSATFAELTTVTVPSMNKGGNPFYGRLTKKTISNVTLNFIYANSVQKQREKENKSLEPTEVFTPHARAWGQRIEGTTLVQHKGELYLEYRCGKGVPKVEYFCDGQPIAKEEVALYIKSASSNAEHQGVSRENEVIMRDVKLNNVAAITLQLNPVEAYEII